MNRNFSSKKSGLDFTTKSQLKWLHDQVKDSSLSDEDVVKLLEDKFGLKKREALELMDLYIKNFDAISGINANFSSRNNDEFIKSEVEAICNDFGIDPKEGGNLSHDKRSKTIAIDLCPKDIGSLIKILFTIKGLSEVSIKNLGTLKKINGITVDQVLTYK